MPDVVLLNPSILALKNTVYYLDLLFLVSKCFSTTATATTSATCSYCCCSSLSTTTTTTTIFIWKS